MKIEIYIEGKMNENISPMNFAATMVDQGLFKTDKLEELAEYLLVFCRHNVTDNGAVCRED